METIIDLVRRIPEQPADYYSGTPPFSFQLPRNILLFSRRRRISVTHPGQFHHRFVLSVNLETEGVAVIDEVAWRFRPGSALLIFPHQFHRFVDIADNRMCWLFITFEMGRPEFLSALKDGPVPLPGEALPWVGALAVSYAGRGRKLAAAQYDRQALLVALLLNSLLIGAGEPGSRAAAASGRTLLPPVIHRVHEYVFEHIGIPVSVTDCARAVSLSESRLRSRFRSHMGMSLGAYIREVKLRKARSLLGTTDLPIHRIAEKTGFSSVFAFSRSFSRHTEEAPKAYRRRLKESMTG